MRHFSGNLAVWTERLEGRMRIDEQRGRSAGNRMAQAYAILK